MTPSELLALVRAMTPGEWRKEPDTLKDAVVECDELIVCDRPEPGYDGHAAWPANASGICALRNRAEALVGLWEAVEAYRVARERKFALMKGELTAFVDGFKAACIAEDEAHDAMLAAAQRVGA